MVIQPPLFLLSLHHSALDPSLLTIRTGPLQPRPLGLSLKLFSPPGILVVLLATSHSHSNLLKFQFLNEAWPHYLLQ